MLLLSRTVEGIHRKPSFTCDEIYAELATRFGVISFLLEMIPFANLVFAFTNTVGAALWAADLEKSAGTAPKLREQARKAQAAESQ